MIGYWISLKMGKQTKLSNITYEIMARDYPDTKWVKCVRNILESVGRNDLWLNEEMLHPIATKSAIIRTLKDQYIQKWVASTQTSSKGKTYKKFKDSLEMEQISGKCT